MIGAAFNLSFNSNYTVQGKNREFLNVCGLEPSDFTGIILARRF